MLREYDKTTTVMNGFIRAKSIIRNFNITIKKNEPNKIWLDSIFVFFAKAQWTN